VTKVLCAATALFLCLVRYPNGEQIGARAAGNERFLVTMNGLHGYIDKAGTIVIPPKYTVAGEFRENRAFFGRDWRLYGFLDREGREIIPMRFSGGASFSEGMALVWLTHTFEGGRGQDEIGFVDPLGRWAIPPNRSRFTWADDFHEGLALARAEKTGDKVGFINKRGQWAIPPRLDWAEPFSEGVAAAAASEGKRGFVDRAGAFVIPPTFAEVHSFSGGLALAYQEPCKPLFIDHSGKVVIKVPGDFATAFHEELSIVEVDGQCGLGGRYGYMDRSGALTIAPQYASVGPFSEGLAAVRVGDKWGFINRKGTLVIPPHFEDTAAGPPGPFQSGLARAYSRIPGDRQPNASAMADLQAGYVNTKGENVWSPTH
jgi:WG containing repeat